MEEDIITLLNITDVNIIQFENYTLEVIRNYNKDKFNAVYIIEKDYKYAKYKATFNNEMLQKPVRLILRWSGIDGLNYYEEQPSTHNKCVFEDISKEKFFKFHDKNDCKIEINNCYFVKE